MRRLALLIIITLTPACVTVSGTGGRTIKVPAIRNGINLTVMNECTDQVEIIDAASAKVRADNPFGSVRRYRIDAGWDNQDITVTARFYSNGQFLGTATLTLQVFNQQSDNAVWQLGGARNSNGTQGRYFYSVLNYRGKNGCKL